MEAGASVELLTIKPLKEENEVTVPTVTSEEDGALLTVTSQSGTEEQAPTEGDVEVETKPEHEHPERDHWSSDLDFILACVGLAVGLGNIWRFPYLCYKNGGGAFLIPYLICLFTSGIPIFMLELAIGQFMNIGSLEAWAGLVPAFKGIGLASFLVIFQANLYYIVILAWALYYLFMSFTSVLPWSHCNNEWNSENCFVGKSSPPAIIPTNQTLVYLANSTGVVNGTVIPEVVTSNKTVDSVIEFWERKILHISSGIEEPGSIVWELALCLLAVWVLVYFCVWRGVKWTGKVVYFTALFPYVILTILLIRGVTLEGAGNGIYFFLKPDFSRLADPQVWIDGGTQILYSFDLAIGAVITLGSYSKFNNNFYRDTFIITSINCGTSIYAGFAVFSVLGFMAHEQNVTVAEVATSGPGLVFLTYPKAITQLPVAPLWSVLFFIMVILVGLDSQFVAVEGFLTPVFDGFPDVLYGMKNRMIVTAIYCAASFLIGLCMVTEGGMFVFQLFDFYCSSGLVLLWIVFFQAIAVSWIFGSSKFQDSIELMIGRRLPHYFIICWKYITPVVSAGIFLFMVFDFVPLTYDRNYVYPGWAQGIGVCMGLVSMICIPIAFGHSMYKAEGTLRERWQAVIKPILESHQIKHADTDKGPANDTNIERDGTKLIDGMPAKDENLEPALNDKNEVPSKDGNLVLAKDINEVPAKDDNLDFAKDLTEESAKIV
ncbi:sodium- and chloride-dependent GABA transporter 1-like [Ruditapes philippinarum]|uniref:sodium- and chloride-dependent GABA transporter 1-like n=1 Tax=Ruditapes philippinarum TaxID=129788 RepID=UPI00295B1C19|nr:sodium- and chloride-dependent GABA transporter 1-like [Ruditapes philippinarum]